MSYTRCHTCGRYLQSAVRFCSEECAQRFDTCQTCGRYYAQGHGYSERFCSEDCAVQYKTIRPAGAHGEPARSFAEVQL